MKNKRIINQDTARSNAPRRLGLIASMASASVLIAVSAGVCYAAPPSQAPSPHTSRKDAIEQSLITKEKLSWELGIKRDATSYKALHAPDYFTVSGKGYSDRAASESSALDANVQFDQCDFSEFRIQFVSENAALVTYRAKASGLDHGKPFQLDSYASSLWMKREGKWLNVFYQATPAT